MIKLSTIIKILLLIPFSCFTSVSFSQYVNFEWARSIDRATGFSGDETYLIGVDASKNVYLAGNFRNTIDLDPGPAVFNLNAPLLEDIFICKLDPSGNFIWGKQLGGPRSTLVKSFHVDMAGNVYSTGSFSGTTDFDPGPGVYNLSADPFPIPECNAIFISKLDQDGNFKWAKQIGGTSPEFSGHGITVDVSGNVLTTGYIVGITDMDPGPTVDNQGANGIVNCFVEKLDNNGNYIFGKLFSGNSNGNGKYIATDNNGNIYTSGYFDGTVDFDPGPGTYNLVSPFNSFTPFISKLNASGNFVWAKKDIGGAIVVDALQNFFTYDAGVSTGILTKYDLNGNTMWSKITGGSAYVSYQSAPIKLDASGNIFITGKFRYSQDFDPGPGVFTMTATGAGFTSDIFICRLDPNGNFVWAVGFGGFAEDYALSLTLDDAGSVYTSGVYNLTVDFDPGPGVYNLSPGIGGGGIFIHKMAHCLNTTYSTLNVNTCNTYTLNNVTYNSSGTYTQTIPNASGCDSIITLNLVLGGSNTTFTVSACESYNWNNQIYTASGTYSDTLAASDGCDSIINLTLNIKNKSLSFINISICEGQNYYGHTLPGTYIDTFTAANGCDSIRTLSLLVNSKKYSTLINTICQGQSYLGYTSSGIYVDTLIAINGCDSLRTLNLTVNPAYRLPENKAICEGNSYLGHTIAGIYNDTLSTVNGCDSIINLTLSVDKPPNPYIGNDTIICMTQTLVLSPGKFDAYLWQDGSTQDHYTVTRDGFYEVTVTNSCGTATTKIKISTNSCTWYFPNSFTPNSDGKNDVFKILNAFNVSNYTLTIFNRYGQKVFETNDYLKGWDGHYLSQIADQGSYVWFCSFIESGKYKNNLQGFVMLFK